MSTPRRIGILAGGGSLPREVADAVAARGMALHIVAIEGETDAALDPYPLTRVRWGEIGRMVDSLLTARVTDLVIIGSVKRPDLATIKPDLGFFRALATVGRLVFAGGDDAVLRGVIAFFESKGLHVVGPAWAAPELVVGEGPLGGIAPDEHLLADAAQGFAVVAALGSFDIGQAAVVADGRIVAIEGAEGTDRLLKRVAELGALRGPAAGAPLGVLVKRAKPAQDERIDLPAIGPGTVNGAVAAGLAGIVVEAGYVLAAKRAELVELADARGFAVAGVALARDGNPGRSVWRRRSLGERITARFGGNVAGATGGLAITQIGKRAAPWSALGDLAKGNAVVAAMSAHGGTRAVIVVRGHVLAVECVEGPSAAIGRAGAFRQWGDRRVRRRAGVVVMAAGRDVTPEVVAAVASAGFAGIAVRLKRFTAGVAQDAVAAADSAGLFLAGIAETEGGTDG